MSLNDYPTPRTTRARRVCLDKSCPKYIVPVETSEQLEREAAAWREVAEKFSKCIIIDDQLSVEAWQSFDRLLAEVGAGTATNQHSDSAPIASSAPD